jgi:hypothetical protein
MHQLARGCACVYILTMAETERLNTTIDRHLAERLRQETEGHTPKLPKKYVVELALQRLFSEVDNGQLELGLSSHGRT